MGIAIPRPQMRAKERKRIVARMKTHFDMMRRFEAMGIPTQSASEKAYQILLFGVCSHGIPKGLANTIPCHACLKGAPR